MALARRWMAGTGAPARGNNGTVVVAYGATLPSVVCAPVRDCSLRLKPGKTIAARRTAATTLLSLVPPQGGTPDPLTPALRDALAGLGFAVADADAQAVAEPEALRYEVGPLDGGLLVRFEFGGAVVGGWYARSRRDALSAGSPFIVREALRE